MRRYIVFGTVAIMLGALVAPFAFAAEPSTIKFTPQISIPGTDIQAGQTINIDGSTIGRYIIALYTFGVYAAGIVATVTLMAAGFVWLTAGGNNSQVEQAKTMVRGALTGYVLLLVSWVLLNTINPNLTEFRSLDIQEVTKITLVNSSYAVFDGQCPRQSDDLMRQFPEGYIFKPTSSSFCPSILDGQVCCYLDVSESGCGLYASQPETTPEFRFYLDDRANNRCGVVNDNLKCYCKRPNEDAKRCWYKLKDDRSQGSFAQCVDSSSIAEGVNPDPNSYTQSVVSDSNKSCLEIITEDVVNNGRRICPQP